MIIAIKKHILRLNISTILIVLIISPWSPSQVDLVVLLTTKLDNNVEDLRKELTDNINENIERWHELHKLQEPIGWDQTMMKYMFQVWESAAAAGGGVRQALSPAAAV